MPGWAKALLTTLGVIVVLVIGAIVFGVVYVARNKDAWTAKGREVAAEGKNFGANSDNQGCVDETVVRYKREPGYFNALKASLFTQGCLEESRPTPGFCDRVPVGDMTKLTEWRARQCEHYDLAKDPNCERFLFMPVVIFCGEQERKESNNQ